jgi:predicted transcriptional regulator
MAMQTATTEISEGARALADYMARHNFTQGQFRKVVGVSTGVVSMWLSGKRKPGRTWSSRLHEVTGIDPKLWDVPARIDPARAAA